jgi:hypothetical protein
VTTFGFFEIFVRIKNRRGEACAVAITLFRMKMSGLGLVRNEWFKSGLMDSFGTKGERMGTLK